MLRQEANKIRLTGFVHLLIDCVKRFRKPRFSEPFCAFVYRCESGRWVTSLNENRKGYGFALLNPAAINLRFRHLIS